MPSPSEERLRKKESSLSGILAEKGDTMDPLERRRTRKQLRRAQRKRRRISVQAARVAAHGKRAAEASSKEAAAAPAAPVEKAKDGSSGEESKSDE